MALAAGGYAKVAGAGLTDDDAPTGHRPLSPPLRHAWGTWRGRNTKRNYFCCLTTAAIMLWVSVLPMGKSQERALRGLICLGLVCLTAVLIGGWAARRTTIPDRDPAVHAAACDEPATNSVCGAKSCAQQCA